MKKNTKTEDLSKKNYTSKTQNYKKKNKKNTKATADDHLTKQQKYEKKGNYQRQNLKKGYQERHTGMTHIYKTRFMANGRSKAFYKNLPDETQNLSTDPKNSKEVEEQFNYNAKTKINITEIYSLNSNSIITKDNVFYKMINEGMILFMFDLCNVPENLRIFYKEKIDKIQSNGGIEKINWEKILKEIFGFEKILRFSKKKFWRRCTMGIIL